MKKITVLCLLICFSISCFSQKATLKTCENGRYEQDVFSVGNKKTVQYASNVGWNGENVRLEMDIFTPNNDSAIKRPLVIFAHGGGFVQGKKEDMAFFCQQFAKKGFVTASISYRLLPMDKIYEPKNFVHEIVKAMSDMKAAIRYFRETIENGNPYKIDENFIFIGGASAGAITALHVGLLDEKDSIPDDFKSFLDSNGGLEGNTKTTENKSFTTKIKGIINYSGSVYKVDWLDKDDPPVFGYHGTADDVVPIGFGINGKVLELYGSKSMNEKADELGVYNLLVEVPNGGHTNIYLDAVYTKFYQDFHQKMFAKMKAIICH